MQLTAFVYRGLFDETPIGGLEDIREIKINEQLDSFSTLDLTINYYVDSETGLLNTTILQEFQRLKIYFEDDSTEGRTELLFDGIIFSLKPNMTGIVINLRDFRGFLESKRVLESELSFENMQASEILTSLFNLLNGKTIDDVHPEAWSFEYDEDVLITDKLEFKTGLSFYNIFKQVALAMGKSWYIKENGKSLFKNIVGTDRSTGENYIELLFDWNQIGQSNIGDIPEVVMQSTISNTIIAEGNKIENQESILEYIRLEAFQNLENEELQNYLNKFSKPQIIYTLDINFQMLEAPLFVGDKIALRIVTGIRHLDIEGNVFILKKESEVIGNEVITLKISVSEIDIPVDDFVYKLKQSRQEIKKLKTGQI